MKQTEYLGILVLMAGILLISPASFSAEQPPRHPRAWGAASNDLCVGVYVIKDNGHGPFENDLFCDIDLRSMSTNRLYIWIPPFERRYEIELRGPDGQLIPQIKPFRFIHRHLWTALEPLASERNCLDSFVLRETFDVRTNGTYTLVVSPWVNAFTNFSAGRMEMRKSHGYFLLPPVTNTFTVDFLTPNGRNLKTN